MVHRFSVGRDIHAQSNGAPLRRDRLYVTLAEPKKFPHFLVLFYCLDHKELHFFPVEEGHRLVVHEYHTPLKSGEP